MCQYLEWHILSLPRLSPVSGNLVSKQVNIVNTHRAVRLSLAMERWNLKPHGKQISFFSYCPSKMEHMDSPKQDSQTLS